LNKEKKRKDDFKVKNVKVCTEKVCTEKEGKGESEGEHNQNAKEAYFKKFFKYELVFHSVKATVGFFEGAYGYSKDVELNCSESLIFFYRRATFLFFCPLLFNSLLNFIFEIDNKPSGGYFNFFSVGWRTLPFLKIITFDIHFNWFLFAVSAWFDFVYFPTGFKNKDLFSYNPHKLSFIPMFLFAFVFDAVSLCVNFKVDDYFYITVNLSYVLQEIVGSFLYRCVYNLSGTESSVCGHCTICTERDLKTFLNEENKGNVNIPPYNSGFGKRHVINLGKNYEIVEDIRNNKANLNNIDINTNTNNMYNVVDRNNFSFANQYFQYNSGYFGGENNMNLRINNNTNNNIYNEGEINVNLGSNNTNIDNNLFPSFRSNDLGANNMKSEFNNSININNSSLFSFGNGIPIINKEVGINMNSQFNNNNLPFHFAGNEEPININNEENNINNNLNGDGNFDFSLHEDDKSKEENKDEENKEEPVKNDENIGEK